MKDANFTRQERHIIFWMRFLTFAFVLIWAVFLFQPNYFLNYVDSVGLVFFNFQSHTLPQPTYEIWWILSLSLMGGLSYCAFLAQYDWLRYHILVPVIIVAHVISAIGFFLLTLFHPTHFFYIVAAAVDGILCFTTAYAYAQAIQSRTYSRIH